MNDVPVYTDVQGTVAFADVGGSALMYAARGDASTLPVITACLHLMGEQVAGCGGRVIKHTGDGVLALFAAPGDALDAAARLQGVLRRMDGNGTTKRPHVRLGISHGHAYLYGDDLYGDVVNVAARLVARARMDEVLLTGEAQAALPPALRDKTRLIDRMTIRDYPHPVAVYQYVRESRMLTDRVPAPRSEGVSLELVRGRQVVVVDAHHPKITIGRAESNDIRVEDGAGSRFHAEVSLRDGRPVLTDLSTNGTYVRPADGAPLRMLREEVVLVGSGELFPGSLSVAPIAYRVRRKRHHAPLGASVARLVRSAIVRGE